MLYDKLAGKLAGKDVHIRDVAGSKNCSNLLGMQLHMVKHMELHMELQQQELP